MLILRRVDQGMIQFRVLCEERGRLATASKSGKLVLWHFLPFVRTRSQISHHNPTASFRNRLHDRSDRDEPNSFCILFPLLIVSPFQELN